MATHSFSLQQQRRCFLLPCNCPCDLPVGEVKQEGISQTGIIYSYRRRSESKIHVVVPSESFIVPVQYWHSCG